MAKRKKAKKTKSKKTKKQPDFQLKEGIIAEIVAVVLIVLALLLIIAGFGVGGALPTGMFYGLRYLLGFAAYILPATFLYSAYVIFRSEDHHISSITITGLLLVVLASAGLFHAPLDDLVSWEKAIDGMNGGVFGHGIRFVVLGLLNTSTSIIALAGLLIAGLLLSLNFTLRDLFMRFKRERADKEINEQTSDAAAKALKSINRDNQPTLKTTIPLEQSTARASLRNTATNPSKDDSEALTASADPDWNFPDFKLLSDKQGKADAGDWKGNAENIRQTLEDFKIPVEMADINVGPRVTQYTLVPESGVRLTKITALEQNIALNLAATSLRIEAPIPGKRAVGVEVPNKKAATVGMRSLLENPSWERCRAALPFIMGQDIAGDAIVGELDKMPHLLIAGATGSGKSVMINSLLTSLLYRNSPSDMKLILVDPKQVELTPFDDIPHLLTPVIVEPEKCISALKWAVAEMERRYTNLAEVGKKNIADYNKMKDHDNMPYITIVIDELADLMMLAARDVEALIVRLAQKSRATGIHLVLATQRPSVDVITGLIKANIPARIAFTVTSQVDSRTILDQAGAEKLLGQGDMLFSSPSLPKPVRIQGALVTDSEVQAVTDHVRMERAPEYNDDVVSQQVQIGSNGSIVASLDDAEDSLYEDAVKVVIDGKKASTSMLQRRLRVGYSRAARLMETMEEQGIIGPADGSRPREVLISSIDDAYGGSDDEDI